ncbi:MAG: hypothetical protein NDJ92_03600 [Thermoanaerobaculia bacterium]|nr:hypothetical protein [Thermoanaerobaculia bacterium]
MVDTASPSPTPSAQSQLDAAAKEYVRLVLALGEHDADYVDAWYGPAELRDAVRAEAKSVESIRREAGALLGRITALPRPDAEIDRLRLDYLRTQTSALGARAAMLSGTTLTFDEESRALYDAIAPAHGTEHFDELLRELDAELPGDGPVSERLEAFRSRFVIPKERLDVVFKKAIEGCRERTLQHIPLPAGESFTVEYVTDKSWSGYNWYQGNFRSLIQVNTDLPVFIDRALDLACHEGYPGHHVYNVLLEQHLVRERGWIEFTVYPLFSPQSLIAEGSANYGIDVAFPKEEKVAWEREHLFPLAGLDGSQAERYYRVFELTSKLAYAGNEAARGLIDGTLTDETAAAWLEKYALMAPERAKQRIRFIRQYRSYVINYNLGKDLVEAYVEALAGGDGEARWRVFTELLSSPRLPSGLAGE